MDVIFQTFVDLLWQHVLWQHVLWQHVLWQHFLWQHVLWQNVLWQRVLWQHVLWQHVLWQHILWQHVLWQHVLWQHVLWQHVLWQHVLVVGNWCIYSLINRRCLWTDVECFSWEYGVKTSSNRYYVCLCCLLWSICWLIYVYVCAQENNFLNYCSIVHFVSGDLIITFNFH